MTWHYVRILIAVVVMILAILDMLGIAGWTKPALIVWVMIMASDMIWSAFRRGGGK